jgi:molybdenum transport protein
VVYIADETIDRFIKEDVPYIDLTTTLLGIGKEQGRIEFSAREDGVLAGSEEVLRIFQKLDIKAVKYLESGAALKKGEVIIAGEGKAENLHMAWKVCQNILEYCCGIASRTRQLLDKAREGNPSIEVVATRKIFPGTKELSLKSIMAGGAYPHRLGLSETILIFRQHSNFMGGQEGLVQKMAEIKKTACEKKVIVEVEGFNEAVRMASAGADGIQFDKVSPAELKEWVEKIRETYPGIILIAAGGINQGNACEYAKTGIDAIVTAAVYFGKPADIKVVIDKTN